MPDDDKRERELAPFSKTGDSFRKIVVRGDCQRLPLPFAASTVASAARAGRGATCCRFILSPCCRAGRTSGASHPRSRPVDDIDDDDDIDDPRTEGRRRRVRPESGPPGRARRAEGHCPASLLDFLR